MPLEIFKSLSKQKKGKDNTLKNKNSKKNFIDVLKPKKKIQKKLLKKNLKKKIMIVINKILFKLIKDIEKYCKSKYNIINKYGKTIRFNFDKL